MSKCHLTYSDDIDFVYEQIGTEDDFVQFITTGIKIWPDAEQSDFYSKMMLAMFWENITGRFCK